MKLSMSFSSLRFKIMMRIVVPSIAIFVAASAFFIYHQVSQQEHLAKNLLVSQSNSAAKTVELGNKQAIQSAKIMAEAQISGLFGMRELSTQFATEVMKNNPQFLGAYFGYEPNADNQDSQYKGQFGPQDKNGRFLPYVYREGESLVTTPLVDMETSLYYNGAKELFYANQGPKPMITEPYVYEGLLLIEQTYPIVIDGKFKGIAGIDRSLTFLDRYLSELAQQENADFLLLSRGNRVISSSFNAEQLRTKNISDTPYKTLVSGLLDKPNIALSSQDPLDEQTYYFNLSNIPTGEWKLIQRVSEATVFAPIYEETEELIILIVSALVAISIIAFFVTRLVSKPIIEMTDKLNAVATSGDFSERLEIRSKDELGQSARAFNTLMSSLQSALGDIRKVMEGIAEGDYSQRIEADLNGDLLSIKEATNASLNNVEENEQIKRQIEEDASRKAARNQRVRQALDNVATNTMIACGDHIIVYINRAAEQLFTQAKEDFSAANPRFDVDKIVGERLNIFRTGSTDLLSLFGDIRSTKKCEITMGHRTFSVTANPILGTDNERIGTVIEWLDRTDEVAIEKEVDGMVEAASQGDFSSQLSTEDKHGFFLTLAKGLNTLAQNTNDVLIEMQGVLSAISKGKLTERINGTYSGKFATLKNDTNATIDKLTEVIGEIRSAAATISLSSKEIASGNHDLSQRTEEQASSLQEAAANMERITDIVKQSAEKALQANALSEEARTRARLGGDVVTRTIGAMDQVSGASKKIADIVGVIDEIAFQTNLLALNAAVEAARAGEQGRGFAVVAGEVRSLAQRSAEAAKEIKALIIDTNKKIEGGAELVIESGEMLREIVEMVEQVSTRMSELSDAAISQSAGLEGVNSMVATMDNTTQQNAALVEQAATAGESMQAQAQEMSKLMAFFTTKKSG